MLELASRLLVGYRLNMCRFGLVVCFSVYLSRKFVKSLSELCQHACEQCLAVFTVDRFVCGF